MIRVAAFSLAGVATGRLEDYAAALTAFFSKLRPDLAVLPAGISFLLCASSGRLDGAADLAGKMGLFVRNLEEWDRVYRGLHGDLARANRLYLAAGTTVEQEAGRIFHTACCFGPDGRICARQRQTHLSRAERAFGFSRGEELPLFELAGMRTGFIVGTDARHPEVGRILALEGAALVVHSGAAGSTERIQPAGIWAQVQQNQFWALEAYNTGGAAAGRSAAARSAVIGPCEITPGFTGYLDRENDDRPYAAAELPEAERLKIKKSYPLLELLRPEAYRGLLPELYCVEERCGSRRDEGEVGE